jgi:PhoPQ-activated pathogenicity-related protein
MARLSALSVLLASVQGQDLFLQPHAAKKADFQWGLRDESPLDAYVNKPDPNYAWFDTGVRVNMLTSEGHMLNLTSQQWLDPSRAHLRDGGSIWTHQVLTIVPKNLKIKNKGIIYITGGCNENPSVPKATDEEPLAMNDVATDIGAIGVVLNQIPNCHMVYPSDPSQRGRAEDAMIAWAWHQFMETGDPEWLPRLPMVKAAMAAMRAVQEYTKEAGIADIDGWLVSGASKRGWTTWMVGSVNCPTCPKIDAIAPVVPIVPNLREGVHHMWRAYGGFTFAFDDYTDVNFTTLIDDDRTTELFKIVDPIHYVDRLARLPKTVLVSSDDEFMMFEWTSNWKNIFQGETHLYIADNAEHSYATGIVGLVRDLSNFANSVFLGGQRPEFDYDLDQESGTITVRVPENQSLSKVVYRHGNTLSRKRRDFRWATAAVRGDDGNFSCPLPLVGPVADGICAQPIVWIGETLEAASPGVYSVKMEKPLLGWKGGYLELYFKSDTGLKQDYQFTTPGMVWPNTLPFEDCQAEECVGNLV